MSAPNSPAATGAWRARAVAQHARRRADARARAAPRAEKPGRLPREVSAASVNWLTTSSRPPPTSCEAAGSSCRPRRRRCAASAACRRAASAMRLACRPARRRRRPAGPAPIAPTRAPAISTCASRDALHQRDHSGVVLGVVEVRLDVHRQQLDRGAQARHLAHQRLLDRGAQRRGAPQRPARRACACAGRRSGAGRRGASPRGRSGSPWWRSSPSVRSMSRAHLAARAPGPSGRRPSATPATRLRARCCAATAMATTGSSHSQPVAGTSQQADDHAGRGPDIGEQVARVGLERHRAVLARLAQHRPGQRAVHAPS